MHEARPIGVWEHPHPDQLSVPGGTVRVTLYERPSDDAKPTSVTIRWIDDEGKERSREEPFHDPIAGASWQCSGCGEAFGQQVKIKHSVWVSPTSEAYKTNIGLLLFCQDRYACAKRSQERVPGSSAEVQLSEQRRSVLNDEPVPNILLPTYKRTCAWSLCRKSFETTSHKKVYHHRDCQIAASKSSMKRGAIRSKARAEATAEI